MPKVYVDRLRFDVRASDSVEYLQERLGGLPITGNYLDQTRSAAAKWQQQSATDRSVTDGSRITLSQASQLFPASYILVMPDQDDELDPGLPDKETLEHGFGFWKWYSGKNTKTMPALYPGEWKRLPFKEPGRGSKSGNPTALRFLYLRINLPKNRTADRLFETKFVRGDGDATAYHSIEFGPNFDSRGYYNIHTEDDDGIGGQWEAKVSGGTEPLEITTGYAKQRIFFQE